MTNFDEYIFTEVRKQDGEDYKPSFLCSIQASIDKYLHQRGYMHSILKSRKFAFSKAALEGKE